MRLVYLACAGAAIAGCESTPSAVHLWSAAELRESARSGSQIAGFAASDWITLRGDPIPLLSPPYTSAVRRQLPDRDGLNVLPAFTEGKSAAFVVAEVWQDIPQVWIQPWYTLVTSYNPANPSLNRLPNSMAIIDIDTTSWFYSPFWELVYVVVPADTAPDKYLSAQQLFQDNLEMHRGGAGAGLLATNSPADLVPALAQGAASPIRPLSNDEVGNAVVANVALKGQVRPSLIFSSSFTWDATATVDEVPLFVFSFVDASGQAIPLGLPSVIGTGPLGSSTPARLTAQGIPRFGSLTRPYLTVLPQSASGPVAGVFIPSSLASLKDHFRAVGSVRVDDINPAIESRPDVKDYVLRVALNSAQCFANPATFPTSCRWLDSQSAIEANLASSALIHQDILFTSPIDYFNGLKVGR